MTARSGRSVGWPGPARPADWNERARIVALSWDEQGVPAIAGRLGCHPKKVRRSLHRFNADGIDGLGDRPGAGRKRRITEAERSAIIALARSVPPGRLLRDGAGELSAQREDGPAQWTLDTLSRRPGIPASRWAQPGAADPSGGEGALAPYPQLGHQHGSGVCPKRTAVVELYTAPPAAPR